MTRLALMLPLALGLAQSARAQVPHGLIEGVNLIYSPPPGVPLALTSGSGYIDGVAFQQPAQPKNPFPFILAGGAQPQPSVAYYCYVVNLGLGHGGPPFQPANQFAFVCSPTGPTRDGHPSLALAVNGVNTVHAVFVGSVITDANAAIVQFYRNGQQVLLNQQEAAVPFAAAGFISPDPIDPGAGIPAAVISFKPPPATIYPSVQPYTVKPLPLKSLSAVIFDFQAINIDADHNQVCILDPNNHGIACPGANCNEACEGEMVPENITVAGGTAFVDTYRATVNVDAAGAVWLGMDLAPTVVGGTQVFPVLRGYIEPIKHLLSR